MRTQRNLSPSILTVGLLLNMGFHSIHRGRHQLNKKYKVVKSWYKLGPSSAVTGEASVEASGATLDASGASVGASGSQTVVLPNTCTASRGATTSHTQRRETARERLAGSDFDVTSASVGWQQSIGGSV